VKTPLEGKKKEELRAEGFLVLATVIWGGSFVVIKTGLEDMSPLLFIGVRFLAAFLVMFPSSWPGGKAHQRRREIRDHPGSLPVRRLLSADRRSPVHLGRQIEPPHLSLRAFTPPLQSLILRKR
jgi:drug/metabolite transporter (DMT)-like permease